MNDAWWFPKEIRQAPRAVSITAPGIGQWICHRLRARHFGAVSVVSTTSNLLVGIIGPQCDPLQTPPEKVQQHEQDINFLGDLYPQPGARLLQAAGGADWIEDLLGPDLFRSLYP